MKLYGLKNVRNIYGFTMRDLAQRIDVSANLINLWERGDVDVPDYRVDNLSNYLGVDKEILFKEKHNTKDLMLIEIARANFKIKEYKSALDNESINEIIHKVAEVEYNANETEFFLQGTEYLLTKIVNMYSLLDLEEFEEFSDILEILIDNILEDKNEWEKFKIMYYCKTLSEDLETYEDDYGVFCSKEEIFEKQIHDALDQLYKIKLYEQEKYEDDEFE